jgi:hypothetical protein
MRLSLIHLSANGTNVSGNIFHTPNEKTEVGVELGYNINGGDNTVCADVTLCSVPDPPRSSMCSASTRCARVLSSRLLFFLALNPFR